jgi:predicted nucleotidyltransferase
MLTEHDIRRITRRIADAYQPLAVGIFGSYATGKPNGQSDLDLFIISRTNGTAPVNPPAVRRLLFDILYPLDVHVFTPAEFEDSAHEYQSFTWVIAQQALLYHWELEAGQAIPSLQARVTVRQDNLERYSEVTHSMAVFK